MTKRRCGRRSTEKPPRQGVGLHPVMEALVPVLEDVIGSEYVLRLFAPVPAQSGGAAAELVKTIDALTQSL